MRTILSCIFSVIISTSLAQGIDSTEIHTFQSNLAEKSTIYTGRIYKPYTKYSSKSSPYFNSLDWDLSSINYNSNDYRVKLKYELVSDLVLVSAFNNENSAIELTSSKISHFTINGHSFINLKETVPGLTSPGFYEIIFDGRISFLCKRRKEVKEVIEQMSPQYVFIETANYYVKINDDYLKVSSLGKLLKLFPDKKKAIKKYLWDNDINFNNNRDQALKAIGAFVNN